MKKTLQIIIPLVKWLGLVSAAAAQFSPVLGEKYAFAGLMVVAVASTLKDSLIKIGDVIDDGKSNNSFGGGAA